MDIPSASEADKTRLSELAEACAAAARRGDGETLAAHEAEIDHIVYRLFALTEAEIALIESALASTRSSSPKKRKGSQPGPDAAGPLDGPLDCGSPLPLSEGAVGPGRGAGGQSTVTGKTPPSSRRPLRGSPKAAEGRRSPNDNAPPGGEAPCAAPLFADELFGLPGDLPVAGGSAGTSPGGEGGDESPHSRVPAARRGAAPLDCGELPSAVSASLRLSPPSRGGTRPSAAAPDPAPRADVTDKEALMAAIRDAMETGGARDRESVIRDAARAAGFQRLGKHVSAAFDDAVRTAARRGILDNMDGQYSLWRQPHTEHPRDFLKEQFLASLGRMWMEREEAVRAFSRWFGFRRTSNVLESEARSLIHGLLLDGRLEKDGRDWIRRA